jgi:hypothetical protein
MQSDDARRMDAGGGAKKSFDDSPECMIHSAPLAPLTMELF